VGEELRRFVAAADATTAGRIVLDGDDGAVLPEMAGRLAEGLHEAPLGTDEPTIPTILTIVSGEGLGVWSAGPSKSQISERVGGPERVL
jgi:hypothetical protein